jgi:hypothetical protein
LSSWDYSHKPLVPGLKISLIISLPLFFI